MVLTMGVIAFLETLGRSSNERISQQVSRHRMTMIPSVPYVFAVLF